MTSGDPDDAGLVPLIDDHGNSYFASWPARGAVVMLGSEGQTYVAARSEAELVSIVIYGDLINAAMRYWFAPHAWSKPTLLEAHRSLIGPRNEWKHHLIAAAREVGIAVEPDPVECIGRANREHLEAFNALVERRFQAEPTPVRAYRPTDRFSIGDRISHPTFGEGVVEAQPAPGKLAVRFATGGVRVLVQAK